ncbi:MAG: histidine phosphatase family protein [Bacteroidales bacterium]
MKRIIFIRHAKAEEMSSDKYDFERSLTLKGRETAHSMAKVLKEKAGGPGLIISSPAFRALETALIFARESGISPDAVRMNNLIYEHFNENTIRQLLNRLEDETDTVSFVGHNFSLTDMASWLAKDNCCEIPKCGIVSLSFNTGSWTGIHAGSGRIDLFLKPKEIL